MHAVVAEQMGVGFHAAEVVDGDRNHVRAAAFDDGAEHEAPDAAKSIDGDLDGHDLISPKKMDVM